MKKTSHSSAAGWTRRDWLQAGAAVGAVGLLRSGRAATPNALPPRGEGPGIYERLGVRPFINCTSPRSMNGGSSALPEVVAAIHAASFHHVNLDELLQKAAPRIAELLGAPAAVIASGAAGAMTLATLAAMTGGEIEALQQVPDTDGLRNEVVAHRPSRTIYDHAIRMTGARIVNAERPEDLARVFGPQTCMAFATEKIQSPNSTIPLETFVKAAHDHGVPVLIDAASDLPLRPDRYLSRGADFVAYSGGKRLHGPQSAGLLLCSRVDLATAAFIAGAPHHTLARPMKVSKEEILGLLAAVEALVTTRDVAAEDEESRRWFRHIIERISRVPGVSGRIGTPAHPGETPTMTVTWDPTKIGYVAREIGERLQAGEPRIMTYASPRELAPTEGEGHEFRIEPLAMYPGDYEIVADRLYEIFRAAPGPKPARTLAAPAARLDGEWTVEIAFVARKVTHRLTLQVVGNAISGHHRGRLTEGSIQGEIDGERVTFESRGSYESSYLRYQFRGQLRDGGMSGDVGFGEYGKGTWKAWRV